MLVLYTLRDLTKGGPFKSWLMKTNHKISGKHILYSVRKIQKNSSGGGTELHILENIYHYFLCLVF